MKQIRLLQGVLDAVLGDGITYRPGTGSTTARLMRVLSIKVLVIVAWVSFQKCRFFLADRRTAARSSSATAAETLLKSHVWGSQRLLNWQQADSSAPCSSPSARFARHTILIPTLGLGITGARLVSQLTTDIFDPLIDTPVVAPNSSPCPDTFSGLGVMCWLFATGLWAGHKLVFAWMTLCVISGASTSRCISY